LHAEKEESSKKEKGQKEEEEEGDEGEEVEGMSAEDPELYRELYAVLQKATQDMQALIGQHLFSSPL
jgi:hypothetical protein